MTPIPPKYIDGTARYRESGVFAASKTRHIGRQHMRCGGLESLSGSQHDLAISYQFDLQA